MSSEIHPSWFSLHARLACVDRRKMYTRDLYGRFKALESLVLFFLLEIKWKKQIYNINWFSMPQNRICSQVNTQEPTLTQTQTAPTPPPPPSFPHTAYLSLDHIRSQIYSHLYLFVCQLDDGRSIFFLFFIFLQSRLSYTLKRCFTTSKKFIWLF